jgi:hypothetical protein
MSNRQHLYPPPQPPKPYWTAGKILALALVVILVAGLFGFGAFNYVRQNSLFRTLSNSCSNGAINHPSCNSCPSTQYYDNGQCKTGDFAMTPTQPNPVPVGYYAASTISIAPIDGFTGTLSLVETSIPVVLACIISPINVTNRGGPASVLCKAPMAGDYDLIITGTSGTLSHSVTLTFIFQDFTIAMSAPLNPGISVDSTITVTALSGFAYDVILSGSSNNNYITCVISPDNIVTGSGVAVLSCRTTIVTIFVDGLVLQLTVTGTSGSLSHTAVATWNCPNSCTLGP